MLPASPTAAEANVLLWAWVPSLSWLLVLRVVAGSLADTGDVMPQRNAPAHSA